MKKMLENKLYIGEYRGNPSYCEPMIDRELFEKVQRILTAKGIRRPPTGRIYIFSGLLRCSECGHVFCGNYALRRHHEYIYYRCNFEANLKICTNVSKYNEKDIERWLLDNIENEIKTHIAEQAARQTPKKKRPAIDRVKLKRKLEKLKELYLNDLITMDEYRADYESLNAQLTEVHEASAPPTNVQALLDFLGSGFKEVYGTLDRQKRQAVWRGIIREISVDREKNIRILFL